MTKTLQTIALAITLACGSLTGNALAGNHDDKKGYVGIGVASFDTKELCEREFRDANRLLTSYSLRCTSRKAGPQLYGGLMFTENFGAEIGYARATGFKLTGTNISGNIGGTTLNNATLNATSDLSSLYLGGVGRFPIGDNFAPFVKLGVHRYTSETTGTVADNNNTATVSVKESKAKPFIGLGADLTFDSFGMRAEYGLYKGDGADVNVFGISAMYRF